MLDSLQEYIDNIYRIFDELDEVGIGIRSLVPEIQDDSKSILRMDAVMFVHYLAASDGDISIKESIFIEKYFGIRMSVSDMRETIKDNNIYSYEFENRVPLSVKMMIEADNKIVQSGTMDSTGSRMIYDFYKLVGQSFLACDYSVSDKEINDLSIYLSNIKKYINVNAQTKVVVLSDSLMDAKDARSFIDVYRENNFISSIALSYNDNNTFYETSNLSKTAPWDTVYFEHACPYCGKYMVRLAKWEDKQFAVAFWGFYAYKLHCRFKCDSCKKMWN